MHFVQIGNIDLNDGKEELQAQVTKLQGTTNDQRDVISDMAEQIKLVYTFPFF